jgi:hypothetical protein
MFKVELASILVQFLLNHGAMIFEFRLKVLSDARMLMTTYCDKINLTRLEQYDVNVEMDAESIDLDALTEQHPLRGQTTGYGRRASVPLDKENRNPTTSYLLSAEDTFLPGSVCEKRVSPKPLLQILPADLRKGVSCSTKLDLYEVVRFLRFRHGLSIRGLETSSFQDVNEDIILLVFHFFSYQFCLFTFLSSVR